MLQELSSYRRLTRAIRGFLDERLTPDAAREHLVAQHRRRESAFLHLLNESVWTDTPNPYRRLFDHCGVGFRDVETLVHRIGLEGALGKLRAAGIYLTQEEFKGRRPICRPGLELPTSAEDFDNPRIAPDYRVRTSGSTGKATSIRISLELQANEAAYVSCFLDSFGLRDRPAACWRGVPPVSSGVNMVLRYARLGKRVDKWFAQNQVPERPDTLRYHLALRALARAGRQAARSLPTPEYVHQDDAVRIARWLAECKPTDGPAQLDTNASSGVRVCIAAQEHGLDISGAFFRFGGEPYTPAKAAVIAASGCRAASHYSAGETSNLGIACGTPTDLDDVHVLTDKIALTQGPGRTGPGGRTVSPLMVTTLLPASPKILINVENGDYGFLRKQPCGCVLGELGFDLHLSGIRSYDKCTSEGMNYLACDLLKIIEEVLPGKFGGHPTDYQFVEEEHRGMPKVMLVVSPRVGTIREAEVLEAVYNSIRAAPGGKLMSDFWEEAHAVEIVRREPYMTESAKIHPLHVERRKG